MFRMRVGWWWGGGGVITCTGMIQPRDDTHQGALATTRFAADGGYAAG